MQARSVPTQTSPGAGQNAAALQQRAQRENDDRAYDTAAADSPGPVRRGTRRRSSRTAPAPAPTTSKVRRDQQAIDTLSRQIDYERRADDRMNAAPGTPGHRHEHAHAGPRELPRRLRRHGTGDADAREVPPAAGRRTISRSSSSCRRCGRSTWPPGTRSSASRRRAPSCKRDVVEVAAPPASVSARGSSRPGSRSAAAPRPSRRGRQASTPGSRADEPASCRRRPPRRSARAC